MRNSRIRLNLAISPKVKHRLERLQEATDGASVTEVIRRALAIYEEVIAIREDGGQLFIKNSNGESERLRIV